MNALHEHIQFFSKTFFSYGDEKKKAGMGKFSAYKMFNNANCLIIFHLPSRALFLLLSSYDNFREIPFAWLQILLYYSVIEFLKSDLLINFL